MTESDEEFVRQIHILERAGIRRVHLDVADAIFVPRRTIRGYEQLKRLNTDIIFDIHLMVHQPERQIAEWMDIDNATRFFVHVEATGQFSDIRRLTMQNHKELGAVKNPETHIKKLEDVLHLVDMVQFMTVHPGAQGRTFVREALDHITEFRAKHPLIPIVVDGGVTPETAPLCVHAGATHLVTGSYAMRAADTARALRELAASVVQ